MLGRVTTALLAVYELSSGTPRILLQAPPINIAVRYIATTLLCCSHPIIICLYIVLLYRYTLRPNY